MPPLDHATLQAVLDKQGMPNTTENLNRIAQFAAVAPDMLEKYLGRGTDASRVGGTDAAIDRSIASTADPRLANLAGPNPYSVTLDPNTGLTNIGPGLVRTPESTGGGRARPAGIPGDFNAPVGAPPFTKQGVTPPPTSGTTQGYESSTGAPMPVPSGAEAATRPPNVNDARPSGNWSQYIVPTILALAAGKFAHKQMGGATPNVPAGATTPTLSGAIPAPPVAGAPAAAAAAAPTPAPANAPYMPPPAPSGPASVPGGVPQKGPVTPGPQPYTGGPQGPHNPSPPNNQPPYMPPPNAAGQTPGDIDAIRKQIKAENDAAALQQEIKNRQPKGKTKAQQDTEATAEAARRATGRK